MGDFQPKILYILKKIFRLAKYSGGEGHGLPAMRPLHGKTWKPDKQMTTHATHGHTVMNVSLRPNSTRSNKLETCSKPGFRPGFQLDGSCWKPAADKSQTSWSQKPVFDKLDLSQQVEIDLAGFRQVSNFFCVEKQVFSRIEAVEFRNDNDQTRPDQTFLPASIEMT